MTKEEEERALAWPMRPDLPGYAVICDAFVNATEFQACFVCDGVVAKGERARFRFEIRQVREDAPRAARCFYGCARCSAAMLLAADPADQAGQQAIAARMAMAEPRLRMPAEALS